MSIDEKALNVAALAVIQDWTYFPPTVSEWRTVINTAIQAYEAAKAEQPDEFGRPPPPKTNLIGDLERAYNYGWQSAWQHKRESGTLKYAPVHMALRRLVLLKEHKDKHGKDAYYEEEKPYAWKQARTALTEIEDGA